MRYGHAVVVRRGRCRLVSFDDVDRGWSLRAIKATVADLGWWRLGRRLAVIDAGCPLGDGLEPSPSVDAALTVGGVVVGLLDRGRHEAQAARLEGVRDRSRPPR